MKAAEIRDLADTELLQKLKDTRAELFNLRFQLATGQLDNTGRIAIVKKDIARLHTELRGRELHAQRDAAAS
jgi:large subunit ribosomal protein L29